MARKDISKVNATGTWECPRCHFILYKRFLFPPTLRVAINPDAQRELCLNDGVLLLPRKEEGH